MEYVCTGATLRCSMGTATSRLRANPKKVSLTGKDQANIADYVSVVNVPGFGKCRSLAYPPTASATAAHYGKLTPMPCVPGTCPKWTAVDPDSLLCGEPALLKPATLRCMYGGTISIVNPGQTLEVKVRPVVLPADIDEEQQKGPLAEQEIPEELYAEFNELDTGGLNKESVLDGIQLALDGAGMIPLLGAVPDLLNASISALRGDWVGAGLSVVAAVPGVGDVVGGAKIAYKGAKIASKSTKAVKTVGKTPLTKVVKPNASTDISKEQLRQIRAQRAGVKPGEGRSGILYDTAPEPKGQQDKFLHLTLKGRKNPATTDNEWPEISIRPNANNPFSPSSTASQSTYKSPPKRQTPSKETKKTLPDPKIESKQKSTPKDPDSMKAIFKYKGNQPHVKGPDGFLDMDS